MTNQALWAKQSIFPKCSRYWFFCWTDMEEMKCNGNGNTHNGRHVNSLWQLPQRWSCKTRTGKQDEQQWPPFSMHGFQCSRVPVLSPIQVSIIVEHPEDPSLHLEFWESHCFYSDSTAQYQPLTPLFCPHISRDLPAHHMKLPYSMGRVQQMSLAHLGLACQALSGWCPPPLWLNNGPTAFSY